MMAPMADEPDNRTLRYLQSIDQKLDRVAGDVQEIKTRVGLVEQQYASVSSASTRSRPGSSGGWS
jgi:UV DNA damage repair endonuclease